MTKSNLTKWSRERIIKYMVFIQLDHVKTNYKKVKMIQITRIQSETKQKMAGGNTTANLRPITVDPSDLKRKLKEVHCKERETTTKAKNQREQAPNSG